MKAKSKVGKTPKAAKLSTQKTISKAHAHKAINGLAIKHVDNLLNTARQLREERAIGRAHDLQKEEKPPAGLDPVEVWDRRYGGLYLDKDNQPVIREEGREPQRATLTEALNWLAEIHEIDDCYMSSTPSGYGRFFRLIANQLDAPRRAEIAAKYWTKGDTEDTVKLTVNASASAFGTLSEASVIHKCTVAEALELLVNHSDAMHEWSDGGFVAYPEYVQAEERKKD